MVSWEHHIRQVEDDEFGLYILNELTIYCPYCGNKKINNGYWELTDYHVGAPPMQNTLYLHWVCGDCWADFKTNHKLDDEGFVLYDEGGRI